MASGVTSSSLPLRYLRLFPADRPGPSPNDASAASCVTRDGFLPPRRYGRNSDRSALSGSAQLSRLPNQR